MQAFLLCSYSEWVTYYEQRQLTTKLLRRHPFLYVIVLEWFSMRGGGGRGLRYEKDGDTRRKFWIRPLKETKLSVAQAFSDPEKKY